MIADVHIPAKLAHVFEPEHGAVRYRCAYGGRGSAKSRTFALMAAVRGYWDSMRVLCTREFQNSIKESFYAEVVGAIQSTPWLAAHYEIGESFIRGANGTEFIFRGLRHNMASIKSTSRIDICIIEEAEDVPENSWRDLDPTVRAANSEIWVIWNPRRKGSPVDKRFRENIPSNAVVAEINWSDNPWFPDVLNHVRLNDIERMDTGTYAHVWDGAYLERSDSQVLAGKVRVMEFEPLSDWDGAYFGADWGFSRDPTTLVKAWVNDQNLYIEYEAYDVGVEIDHTPALFDQVPSSRDYVIRADSARPETISFMRRAGFNVVAAVKGKGSVEDGIARLLGFRSIIIHPRCVNAIRESYLWSYKVDRLTGDVLPSLVDANNHIWDAVRYAIEPIMRHNDMALPFFASEIGQPRRF